MDFASQNLAESLLSDDSVQLPSWKMRAALSFAAAMSMLGFASWPALVVTPAPDVQFLAGKELNVDTKTLVQVPVPESVAVRAGSAVFVSGQLGSTATTFEEQAIEVLQKVGAGLASLGLNRSHIVHTEGVLANINHLTAWNVIYNQWMAGVEVLPASTVYQAARLDGNAKVEVAVEASTLPVAGTNGSQGNVPQNDSAIPANMLLPFTTVVTSADLFYLSGLQALGATAAMQIAGTLRNIDLALEAVGLNKHHLLKVDAILADIRDLPTYKGIYSRWLAGVEPLPALMVHQPVHLCVGGLVEITVIASKHPPFSVNVPSWHRDWQPPMVRAQELAYTSGIMSGVRNSTTEEQLGRIFQSLSKILSAAELTKHHIVQSRVVLQDITDLAAFSSAYGRWLSGIEVLPTTMVHQTGHVDINEDVKVQVAIVARRS